MSWLEDALNDQEGRELVEAIHERKAAAEEDLTGRLVSWVDDCAAAHRSKVLRMVGSDVIEIDHEDTDNPGSNQLLTVAEVDVLEWNTIKDVPLQRVADLEEREQTAREREAAAMWDQLPPFMRGHLLKALPEDPDEPGGEDYSHGDLDPEDIGEADVICSSQESHDGTHRPVLDIDFPAALIPSTTPGHFHLYLDKPIAWSKYRKLLKALAEAGIIQDGYAGVSEARGYTSVRLPWVQKHIPATGHWVVSEPEGTTCGCGFAPDDAMDRSTQHQEVVEHVRTSGPDTEEPNEI